MAFQTTNDAAATKWSMPRATKRRMGEEDEDDNNMIAYEGVKRLSCQHQRSVDMATSAPQQQKAPLPSITYASPDYRPPPRSDALWLQPAPSSTLMMMDEELTDEEALLTPLPSMQQQQQQQPKYTSTAPTVNLMDHHQHQHHHHQHSSFSQVQA
ncbi:predicted protein [Lichtheimia corymbifera JMRC:FSU:9682]|uniref:Uncharacterized protein n=1 Tax=Lichtheimia corymbifera JMRC:FSU:9682 TaxID=1263082 RepID=A0A068RG02_9FUNG|nr:predicted protein [Lichtheimia corymbifera JMRC:FSU:9682]